MAEASSYHQRAIRQAIEINAKIADKLNRQRAIIDGVGSDPVNGFCLFQCIKALEAASAHLDGDNVDELIRKQV